MSENTNHYIKLNSGAVELNAQFTSGGSGFTISAIKSPMPIPIVEGLVIETHIKLSRQANTAYGLYSLTSKNLAGAYWNSIPDSDWQLIDWCVLSDGSNYKIRVRKKVDNTFTNLVNTTITNQEGTFRVKFHIDHAHIYFHDGSGSLDESTDELEESPLTDWFDHLQGWGYPSFFNWTNDTTATVVSSNYIKVTYPKKIMDAWYQRGNLVADQGTRLYNPTPWRRVFDEDHDFGTVGPVVQTNFLKFQSIEGSQLGIDVYFWDEGMSNWVLPMDRIFLVQEEDAQTLQYPRTLRIKHHSPERTSVIIRMHDDSAIDLDAYADIELTFLRGKRYFLMKILDCFPLQEMSIAFYHLTKHRFGYVGDPETHMIGDADVPTVGQTADNTTLTDNFFLAFDNEGSNKYFVGLAVTKKPNGNDKRFRAYRGGGLYLENINEADFEDTLIAFFYIPYTLEQHLYTEAEDGTLISTASIDATQTDDVGDSVLCDNQGEGVRIDLTAGTQLPVGRYKVLIRVKASSAVANDLGMAVQNITDTENRNADMKTIVKTPSTSFAYYEMVFDVFVGDGGDNDTIRVFIRKEQATANSIWVDYFLIVPLFDGNEWPGDVAHELFRHAPRKYKVRRIHSPFNPDSKVF
jgi:hypothetical protein